MKTSYMENLKEFEKILLSAQGSTDLEISADIINKIIANDKLKDALFKITLFEEGKRYEYTNHIYKVVKGNEIYSALYEYLDEKYKFTFDILGDN